MKDGRGGYRRATSREYCGNSVMENLFRYKAHEPSQPKEVSGTSLLRAKSA
jgi:hypothetical protein